MQPGTLVSAAASPFDANHASAAVLLKHQQQQQQLQNQQQQHRQSHRSNSLSSASAVTVQQPGSLSRVRSESQSTDADVPLSRCLSRDPMSQDHRRRKSVAIDPSEHHGNDLTGVTAASNRWSHSTASSSVSSNKHRKRSSSGAVLSSLVGQSFSPRQKPLTAVDASPRASPQKRHVASQSIASSPTRSRRTSRAGILPLSVTALPPLHTTPSLTDPNETESPSTTQTIPTPSNHSSYPNDGYFDGNDYEMAKTTRVMMIRNPGAPMSVTNTNRAAGSQNHDRRRGKESTLPEHERRPSATGDGSSRSRRPRTRERTEKDKKAMLSKALQKANTAVLLDNAQNYEGALQAYGDACDLLTNVMDRTSADDDKRKLDAIRVTYSNRMQELRQLVQETGTTSAEKNLPARPTSDDSLSLTTPNGVSVSPIDRALGSAFTEMPSARITDVPRLSYPRNDRDSFFERTMQAVESSASFTSDSYGGQVVAGAEPEPVEESQPQPQTVHLPPPEDAQYMPRPLSPKRPPPLPPGTTEGEESSIGESQATTTGASSDAQKEPVDSTSWLNTIDESGSSCSDSVHSIDDQQGMRRKHIRGASGETDPDFDAAFDAAVEAAYNEGFEPDLEAQRKRLTALQKHAKMESIQVPASAIDEILPGSLQATNMLSMDPDEAEEERILDGITHDFSQSFNFDLQSKSALPRTSDSSGYSRSTWQSSQLSDRATNATSLSTVAEDGLAGRLSKSAGGASTTRTRGESGTALPPPSAPPTTALPQLPVANNVRASGVRSRRLSGMNPKQLKIETSPQPPEMRKRASTFHHTASPFAEEHEEKDDNRLVVPTPSDGHHESILQSPPSLEFQAALDDMGKPIDESAVGHRPSYEAVSADSHPARPQLFRKNKSSISLRAHTEHTLLLASPDVENGPGLFTPMSSTFMSFAAAKRVQDPLHSQRANFPAFAPASIDGQQYGGGIYLFDTSLSNSQLPTSPRSPNLSPQPTSLEPCPESFLLRPFWLMRALAQTITHPRGGFLSTKLFVPREVWQTRGVKLKLVEDKVSNCDLLTAALGRLANADTYDADAVMEELQGFEEVMERVQATLTKKLGSDVGVHGVAGIFKDASAATVTSAMGNAPGSDGAHADKAAKSNSGKSYLTSWRKLRNKSSGAPLSGGSHQAVGGAAKTPTEKEQHTMPSVPMTSFVPVERRGNKRDARNTSFDGPNQEYMGSLARLFDGVQVLDQIARQVEDPGLKHSSPTHVGLELSIRHAAEFFGFFVCRFVLADLTLLMDKFIKRGTEWVLA